MKKFARFKKLSILAVSATMLMSLLSACGGGSTSSNGNTSGGSNGGSSGNEAKAPEQTPAKPQGPVDIVFYNASNSNATFEAFISSDEGKEIQAKFPHVNIKLIATGKGTLPQDVLSTGQQIDIIINSVYSYPVLLETGLVQDITDLIKKNKYDLTRLEPTFIDFQKQLNNGQIYGLPIANAPVGLFYNKLLFDKFGVPSPKDGMTWDETYELAKRMTRSDGGVQYHGFATRYPFMYNVNQLSLSYWDAKAEKVTVNSDKFRLFMNNFTRFMQIEGNGNPNTDQFFKEQNVAMSAYQLGRWEFNDWDVVSLPYFNEAKGIGPQVYGTYWNVASISKNKDLAFEIIASMTAHDYQMRRSQAGNLPVVTTPEIIKAFDQKEGRFKGKNVNALFPTKRATPTIVSKYDDAVAKAMNKAFTDISAGKIDVNTALREAEEAAMKDIQAMKK